MADDQDAAADMPVKTEWVGTYKSENDVFDEQRAFLNTLPQSEKDGRADGLFFSHMESIWGSNDATIQAEDFETIRRISEQGHAYDLCCKYIHDDSIEIGRGSRSGKTNADENEAKIDAYGNDNCRAAHLLSRADVCLCFYRWGCGGQESWWSTYNQVGSEAEESPSSWEQHERPEAAQDPQRCSR